MSEIDIVQMLEASVGRTRRFESGPYAVVRLTAPSPDQARVLFDDLAEAATNLNGRPLTEGAAAERTDARVYRGRRRIVIGRLRIEVNGPI